MLAHTFFTLQRFPERDFTGSMHDQLGQVRQHWILI